MFLCLTPATSGSDDDVRIPGIGRLWQRWLERYRACSDLHHYRSNVAAVSWQRHPLLTAAASYSIPASLGDEVHTMLQVVLQNATPISAIVGLLTLINAINNYRRQVNMEIFMKYTERYERILERFPQDALAATI
jgi:hypothetical protein